MSRRSYGTRTITGLNAWLYRNFVKSRSSANDLRDVKAGQPIQVYCFARPLDEVKTARSSAGYIDVQVGAPMTWRAMIGGDQLVISEPQALLPSESWLPLSRFTAFIVDTSAGPRRVAIPKADVDLLAWALDGKPV